MLNDLAFKAVLNSNYQLPSQDYLKCRIVYGFIFLYALIS